MDDTCTLYPTYLLLPISLSSIHKPEASIGIVKPAPLLISHLVNRLTKFTHSFFSKSLTLTGIPSLGLPNKPIAIQARSPWRSIFPFLSGSISSYILATSNSLVMTEACRQIFVKFQLKDSVQRYSRLAIYKG